MDEFEVLLAKYYTALERFVKFRLPSAAEAEDVLQEVSVTAYKKFGQLKSKEAFQAWLMGIARNKCNDYFRKKAKEMELPQAEIAKRLNIPLGTVKSRLHTAKQNYKFFRTFYRPGPFIE